MSCEVRGVRGELWPHLLDGQVAVVAGAVEALGVGACKEGGVRGCEGREGW